ncbi:MAG: TIGR03943 family protein, partial [Anaerolineales bacterium]|nr:TIGR03943 family protein [Anaerolineales bacterium]
MPSPTPRVFVLLALGAFLVSRLLNDVILLYINQRYVWLTALGGAGLLFLGVSYWLRPSPAAHHDHDHVHDHDHAHDGHSHAIHWAGLVIVALPVVLGLMIPARPLGAGALANRSVDPAALPAVPPPADNTSMAIPPAERNVLDWQILFQQAADPAPFAGLEARVVGFVYRGSDFPADSFMVSRYALSCCVADAAPIGLLVRWPDTADLAADQWVEVHGRFEIGTFNGF